MPFGPVKVNVVPLTVEGFIASLKVALTTVVPHAAVVPFKGLTDTTVGKLNPGVPGLLSKSLHPVVTRISSNAANQIL